MTLREWRKCNINLQQRTTTTSSSLPLTTHDFLVHPFIRHHHVGQIRPPSQTSSYIGGDRVLEKHPNLSVFHDDDDTENKPAEVPFPTPSSPSSPSKNRHGVLRRMSRSGKHDNGEHSKVSSALKLPLRLPRKAKSTMSIHTNGKCIPTRRHFCCAHLTKSLVSQIYINTTESAKVTPTVVARSLTDTTRWPETPIDGRYDYLLHPPRS